jgi:hypothetical protein
MGILLEDCYDIGEGQQPIGQHSPIVTQALSAISSDQLPFSMKTHF